MIRLKRPWEETHIVHSADRVKGEKQLAHLFSHDFQYKTELTGTYGKSQVNMLSDWWHKLFSAESEPKADAGIRKVYYVCGYHALIPSLDVPSSATSRVAVTYLSCPNRKLKVARERQYHIGSGIDPGSRGSR